MKDQIMQMLRENPRTLKELSQALGLSKTEVINHLNDLPVRGVKTIIHGGPSRPVSVIHYVAQ